MPKGGKGDVDGQRETARARERIKTDPVFAAGWRAQRRAQKQRAAERRRSAAGRTAAGQWTFDTQSGPNLCRTCRSVIEDRAMYCNNAYCNPTNRSRRRRRSRR